MSYIIKFQFWKNPTIVFSFLLLFFENFLMIPNDKYTWEGQKFILCFITCSLHKKSTIKLKLFDVAISVNFWCHNPSLIESPSVPCVKMRWDKFWTIIPTKTLSVIEEFKVRTFWETHRIWKNLPHALDVY